MKYKGIIFDLDGTAVPNRSDGVPSERLIKVINKLKAKVKIGFASGRTIGNCRHIIKLLDLNTPCIIVGGTKIIDPITEQTIWEKQMTTEQVRQIVAATKGYDYPINFQDEKVRYFKDITDISIPENIVYIQGIKPSDVEPLFEKLSQLKDIVGHTVPSWTKGLFEIHITHKEATKEHAIKLWLEILKLQSAEVVGFGDGGNDLPIFEAVGYKVAMADADDKLKQAADFITQSAEEDGVAIVLEELFVDDIK